MIKELSWDSDFFNYRIGEWNGEAPLNAEVAAFDLIYVKSRKPVEPQLVGFRSVFSETRVIFAKQLTSAHAMPQDVRPVAEQDNTNRLYELAYESGKYSRFKLDERFGKEKFEKLYRAWVDNSLSRRFADDVLVYTEDGAIIGFASYKQNGICAEIGLIAVAPGHQGKGIGKKLLHYIESILISKGVTELHIPTQLENNPACAFYSKLDYKVVETIYIKHYWKINDTL